MPHLSKLAGYRHGVLEGVLGCGGRIPSPRLGMRDITFSKCCRRATFFARSDRSTGCSTVADRTGAAGGHGIQTWGGKEESRYCGCVFPVLVTEASGHNRACFTSRVGLKRRPSTRA